MRFRYAVAAHVQQLHLRAVEAVAGGHGHGHRTQRLEQFVGAVGTHLAVRQTEPPQPTRGGQRPRQAPRTFVSEGIGSEIELREGRRGERDGDEPADMGGYIAARQPERAQRSACLGLGSGLGLELG